jgi:hypothetical protein
VLIIPKKVIATHDDIKDEDRELLGHLRLVAVKLAKQLGLDDGYRLVLNCRERWPDGAAFAFSPARPPSHALATGLRGSSA